MKKIAIIGVGLIGASLGMALRKNGFANAVVGYGRSSKNLEKAVQLGAIDRFEATIREACVGAEIVVVAASLGATASILREVGACVADGSIITDVGSVKGSVVRDARMILGAKFDIFVPGHPIAGNEKSGAEAAIPDLFKNHKVILTPTSDTRIEAVNQIEELWTELGSEVLKMTVESHDRALAMTSHLPHLLAYNVMDTLLRQDDSRSLLEFSAGGFRDFTRIASSNPELWADILLMNKDNIVKFCGEFKSGLNSLILALEATDRELIIETFSDAKKARDTQLTVDKKR